MEKLPQLIEGIESITTYKGLGSLAVILVLGTVLIVCIFKYLAPILERAYEKSLINNREANKHLYDLAKLSMEENKKEITQIRDSFRKLENELRLGLVPVAIVEMPKGEK